MVFILPRQHRQKQTLLWLVQVNGRTGLTTPQHPVAVGQSEFTLNAFPSTMALKTVLLEDGVNFVVKVLDLGRIGQFRSRSRLLQNQCPKRTKQNGSKLVHF